MEPVDSDTQRRRALAEEYDKRPDPIFAKITGRGTIELPITPSGRMFVLPAGGQGYALNLLDLFRADDPATALPLIQYGNATGADAGQWYQVNFAQRYNSAPRVVASGVYRTGDQPQRSYTAPSFSAPRFTMPTFTGPNFAVPPLSIPSLSITLPPFVSNPDWRTDLRNRIRNLYKKMLAWAGRGMHDGMSDKGPSWWKSAFNGPANVCQGALYGPEGMDFDTHKTLNFDASGNPIESPSSTSAYTKTADKMDELGNAIAANMEDIVNRIIPSDIQKFRDNSQTSINSTLGSYNKNVKSMFGSYNKNLQGEMNKYNAQLNNKIGTFSGNLQTQMDGFSNSLQDATNQVSKQAENSINQAINQLYSFIGIPGTNRLTVAQIKSVTVDGFQFLSQGDMEIQWIAVGS